jgi:tryptophan 7-halogenase
VHYRYNERRGTPFWRAARSEVDVSGLQPAIDRYQSGGPYLSPGGLPHDAGDPAFGYSGLMMLLLGQEVPAPAARPVITKAQWQERLSQQRRIARWALPQREALEVLRNTPEMLAQVTTSPLSWCMAEAERITLMPHRRDAAGPKSGMPGAARGGDALLRSLR